jgi:hypothetical protein
MSKLSKLLLKILVYVHTMDFKLFKILKKSSKSFVQISPTPCEIARRNPGPGAKECRVYDLGLKYFGIL